MKLSVKEFLHRSRASQTVPLGFSVGSGVAFIVCLLFEEHVLGNFDRQVTMEALIVAFWAGISCGAIALLLGSFFFRSQNCGEK